MPNRPNATVYIFAVSLGLCVGALSVITDDLLFTALLVLASTMLLGAVSSGKPWRWTLLVSVFVPVAQLFAFLFMNEKPYRAQIYESFLSLLPGIVGAYGGALGRGVVHNIMKQK
jgi:cell division protein FtsW (lipid II flippase)